jgi:F0F1-type ATP synthase membrane subunit b/b'
MMARTILLALCSALLLSCTEADLRELGRETEEALNEAGDALDELAGQTEGPLRGAAEEALDAADEARDASREFEENPTTETRQALEAAGRRVDDASAELEAEIDQAPEPVRDLLQRALDALTDVRQTVQRQLDEG